MDPEFFAAQILWVVHNTRHAVAIKGNHADVRQVWTVSLPVVVLNSPAVSDPALGGSNPAFGTARDVVGLVLWALGMAIETVTDGQKVRRHILFFVR
jgi:hypothetical protein